ncbi:GDSL-type esterase/lipase family protein [Kocuria sp. CNJ-770]|uniref:SGNH/GDSL hydrolase family protein n=1 Tax=Kocuria sp. CNJ-770 TaxID=1904964 RepID=UPI0013014CE5|nr:GDSL-type esterase/lipase family protein [Kocuria sp. CNJ-770]
MQRTSRLLRKQLTPLFERNTRSARETRLASQVIIGLSVLTIAGLGAVAVQYERAEARNSEAGVTYSPPVAPIAANKEVTRFAVVGDSTTEGNSLDIRGGRPGDTSWVYYAQSNTTRFVGGWADSGAQTSIIAENFTEVKGAEVLVILAGQNDTRAGVPFDEITDNLKQVVKTAGNVRVVVSSVLPQDDMPEKATEYNERLREYAQKQGWTWVDAAASIRDGDRYQEGLTEDGIHPTAEGAKILGNTLEKAIEDAGT